MPSRVDPAPEPVPLTGAITFEEGDLRALSAAYARNPEFNDRRLVLRRKLLALGKRFLEGRGLPLECRTSLHNPHAFNHMQVRRLWLYVCRAKKEKSRLRRVLGPELGKDLDAAYRNAYLCLAVESEAVEVSLRIHSEAWFDGQNLLNRLRAEGQDEWRGLLNGLAGFRLRLADWKGEWRCGELTRERLEEYLSYYVPGEHALAVERRWPAPEGSGPARAALFAPEAPGMLLAELERLLPLYRYAAWSETSDFLFAR
jgi:hypothetical protein